MDEGVSLPRDRERDIWSHFFDTARVGEVCEKLAVVQTLLISFNFREVSPRKI